MEFWRKRVRRPLLRASRILAMALILSPARASAAAGQAVRFASLAEYRSAWQMVFEEHAADLDADGDIDYLMVHSDAEYWWANVLLAGADGYTLLTLPDGEEFALVETDGHYDLRVGVPTFPAVGSIQGADRHVWYDFYGVMNDSLQSRNSEHLAEYRRMLARYRERIRELEEEIQGLQERASRGEIDDGVVSAMVRPRRDHIARYEQFIARAVSLLEGSARAA